MSGSRTRSTKETPLLERRALREANAEKRAQALSTLKDEGNDAFRAGDYKKAACLYARAIEKYGPKAPLCSNLATALSKLDLWTHVEWAATLALKAEPRMIKARFRRALARKELNRRRGAVLDLETIVMIDSACAEAKDQLTEMQPKSADEYDEDQEEESQDLAAPDPEMGTVLLVGFTITAAVLAASGVLIRMDRTTIASVMNLERTFAYTTFSWQNLQAYTWCQRLLTAMEDPAFNLSDFDVVFNNVPSTRVVARLQLQKRDKDTLRTIVSDVENAATTAISYPLTAVPTDLTRSILLISLEHEDYFDSIYAILLDAIAAKRRVVRAFDARQALEQLASPTLDGVIVMDAGIAKKPSAVVGKLVNYVKGGGTVVMGCQFSSCVDVPQFNKFFKHFGLPWTSGSYHRTTFSLNPSNATAAANPSLPPTINIKAVSAHGISSEMAVYVDSQASQTRIEESPVVIAKVGKGYLALIGESNGESVCTPAYLALLRILDAPTPVPSNQPTVKPTTAPSKTSKPAKGKAKTTGANSSAPKGVGLFGPPLIVALLDGKEFFMKSHSRQFNVFKSRMKVDVVTTAFGLFARLDPASTRAVYLADAGITTLSNLPLAAALVAFVKTGGHVVVGGLFPSLVTPLKAESFFALFDQFWTFTPDCPIQECRYERIDDSEIALLNPSLPKDYPMRSQNVKNISSEVPIYQSEHFAPGRDHSGCCGTQYHPDAPVVRARVGRGSLTYVGDVDDGDDTSTLFRALFGILDPKPPPPIRRSQKFVIFLGPEDADDGGDDDDDDEPRHTSYDALFDTLLDSFLIETLEDLSTARVTDLMTSSDLVAVFIANPSIVDRQEGYLLPKLVEFTDNGGTVIFLNQFAVEVKTQKCLPFFIDAWDLHWGVYESEYNMSTTPNRHSVLFKEQGKYHPPETPVMEGARIMYSSNSSHVPYYPRGGFPSFWKDRKLYMGPALYAAVGKGGHVGYIGSTEAEDAFVALACAMLGVVWVPTHDRSHSLAGSENEF